MSLVQKPEEVNMSINVVGRQLVITQEIRSWVEKAMLPLTEIGALKVSSVNVTIDREKKQFRVSAVVNCKYHVITSEIMDFDLHKAIDSVTRKLENQMQDLRDKIQDHRAEPICNTDLRQAEVAQMNEN